MNVSKNDLFIYETSKGKLPLEEWLQDLRDRKARAIIRGRLDRLECGNIGQFRAVGEAIYELKIDFGPGYRVYFGRDGKTVIILLCGGDKSSQRKYIRKAQEYWQDYKRGNK